MNNQPRSVATEPTQALGLLVSVHGTSPAYLQRAAVIIFLSFAFFLLTLVFYGLWADKVWLLLAAAFLILHLFTLTGWWMQKRNVVRLYENGIQYRKFSATWNDIIRVEASREKGVTITNSAGETVTLGRSVAGLNNVAQVIKVNLKA